MGCNTWTIDEVKLQQGAVQLLLFHRHAFLKVLPKPAAAACPWKVLEQVFST